MEKQTQTCVSQVHPTPKKTISISANEEQARLFRQAARKSQRSLSGWMIHAALKLCEEVESAKKK